MKRSDLPRAAEWVVALLLLCLPATTFYLGRTTAKRSPSAPESRDTLIITHTDTIVREKPVYATLRVVDTLRIAVRDTVRLHDTLFMAHPRAQARYDDSLYTAWVSGITPALDSIRLYATTQTVTVTERVPVRAARRWGLGLSAGYGAALAEGGVRISPYVGVSIHYNLITW